MSQFTFGKFTRPYLDFTRLSIKPGLNELSIKFIKSAFKSWAKGLFN